jgi:CelD/BcsL family acetyltransferase involved in cellulose biosynthesis
MITVTPVTLQPQRFQEYAALSHTLNYGANLHPVWLQSYIEAFEYTDRHVVLESCDSVSGALLGFLPLVRKDSRESRFITQRRLVPNGYRPTDFFGFPALRGREAEVGRATAEWLDANRGYWDALMIDLLVEDQGAWAAFAARLTELGFGVEIVSDRNYLTLDTTGSYDNYVARLGAAKLKDLRYYRNRLLKRGSHLDARHLSEGMIEHFDEFIQLYRNRRSTKTQSDPYTRVGPLERFFRLIVERYGPRGWLTLSVLKLDETIVAFCYCLVYDGVLFYYNPAFRDEFKDCAPGKLLLMELIRRAFEDPTIREFNFMRSEYAYKHWFEPESKPYFTITTENHRSHRTRALRAIGYLRSLHGMRAATK